MANNLNWLKQIRGRKMRDERFIESINNVYENCSGFDNCGDVIEFYDKHGCVLMTITQVMCNRESKIQFRFSYDDEDMYCYDE